MAVQNTLMLTTSLAATLLALLISEFDVLLVGINAALFFMCAEKLRREWSLRWAFLIQINKFIFSWFSFKANTNSRYRLIEWSSYIWCCIIISRCNKTRFLPHMGTEVSPRNAQAISYRTNFQNLYGNHSFGFYFYGRRCRVAA